MTEKQQLKITYVRISELIPYANNARVHSEEQLKQIANSILEFGFNDPVARDGANGIIEGHGRVLAAELLVSWGHEQFEEVPTIQLGHLSERQKQAYILAHNRIAQNSSWDFAKLSIELDSITNLDFDPLLTGFDEQELDALLKMDKDLLPELFGSEKTKPGKGEKIAKKKEASKIVHTCPNCEHKFSA